jgi:hypothetical protein
MAYSGSYQPLHPEKYRGNPTTITYRSHWERQCMRFFDTQPNVLWWQSEEFCIPYKSVVSSRVHRYFPDFLVCVQQKDGTAKTLCIEVKPAAQCQAPQPTAKGLQTRRYLREVLTYCTNQAKWQAAKEYCADHGYEFTVWTEREIPFL